MAGRGPAPKGAEWRHGRNVPARGEWTDVRPLERPVIGALPRRSKGEGGAWPARTRAAWEAWRRDPVTQLYGDSDRVLLLDLAHLHAEVCTGSPKVTLMAEVRLRIDALGLSPKGKRDLRWRVMEESSERPRQVGVPARERFKPASERMRELRVRAVDPAIDDDAPARRREDSNDG